MRIILVNRLGCELDGWSSVAELSAAILRDDVVFCDGDKLLFTEDEAEEFDGMGNRLDGTPA